MSRPNGPHGRYARVRGTQSDLLRELRRGDWSGSVIALAGRVGRPERNVWLALAGLAARGFVKYRGAGDTLRVWITQAGRAVRL